MKIKQRIWSLPIISGLVFGLGVAVSVVSRPAPCARSMAWVKSTTPISKTPRPSRPACRVVTDALQSAVAEGEARSSRLSRQRPTTSCRLIGKVGALEGHEQTAELLRARFDAYYRPAVDASKLMLGVTQGDSAACDRTYAGRPERADACARKHCQ